MKPERIKQLKDESLSICEAGAGEWLREALEEVELLQAKMHRWIKAGATCAEDRLLLEVENKRLKAELKATEGQRVPQNYTALLIENLRAAFAPTFEVLKLERWITYLLSQEIRSWELKREIERLKTIVEKPND